MKIKITDDIIKILGVIIVIVYGFYFFNLIGVRTLIGMFLLYILPAYVILSNLKLDGEELIFFSFFLSLGLFPLVVFCVNRVIPSLRVSITVTFGVLILIGVLTKKRKWLLR